MLREGWSIFSMGMDTRVRGWGLLAFGLPGAFAVACGSDVKDCAKTLTCAVSKGGAGGVPANPTGGAPLSGAGVGGAGGAISASQCRKTSDIDDPDGEFNDANCDGIDGDKLKAIFVSPLGVDTATGAFGAPVKTIAKGVALALAAQKDVYVCQGQYAENLTVEGSVSLRVYGGYACADWKRSNQRPVVNPAAGVALRVKGVVGEVLIDRIELVAPDATEASGSSVAAWFTSAKRVVLRQVKLQAGRGASGSAGMPAAAVAAPPPAAPKGEDSPARSVICYCASAPASCFQPLDFTSMSAGCDAPGGVRAAIYVGRGGEGANHRGCTENPAAQTLMGSPGQPGLADDGVIGQVGTPGAPGQGIGSFGEEGYVLSNSGLPGGIGHPGKTGRGGKGGDSVVALSASHGFASHWVPGGRGGYGGFPGCGGLGGGAGTAGGASIALLAWESEVNLEWAWVATRDGGEGGNGAQGAVGQPGGMGGLPGLPGAVAGQKGGNGGKGGDGGPGGGGPALGIVAVGIAPVLAGVSFEIGRGGLGGKSVANSVVPDAASGISADYWPVNIRPVANGAAGAAGTGGN
jgi:hypothetical protein